MNVGKEMLRLREDIFKEIVGQADVKRQLRGALFSQHHLLIVGPPGVGKTSLARNVANILPPIKLSDCPYRCNGRCPICSVEGPNFRAIKGEERFIRVQGSPDLTVEDVIGDIDPIKAMKFGPLSLEAFTPGKIFRANKGILFFDEINRAPEKLQNALLQVLQEGKVTLSSYIVDIPADFIFIGTLNPKDATTERLSDVMMDRFDFIYMGYPEDTNTEKEIVLREGKKIVEFDDRLLGRCIDLIRDMRDDENLEKVPSVRASISLYERAQSNAAINGREAVTIEDIRDVIISVLLHRIELKPSKKFNLSQKDFIKERFDRFVGSKEKGDSL